MGRAVLTRRSLLTVYRAPLRVWGVFALLMTVMAVPLFSTVLPPLFDYPNHLARMHLLAEGGNAFYAVRWAPLPNLAQDLIVPALGGLMPLALAAKLFLVMIFALIGGGTIWLNRMATGAWRPWPLLVSLVLYNRTFLWGFLNYLFGIGVALCGAALWLALERRRWWLRVLLSSLVALACYISHIAAFGLYALIILGVELSLTWAEFRARRWPALVNRIMTAGMQFIIPGALFVAYWQQTGSEVGYADWWRKADLLFDVFDNYDRIFDVGCFIAFLCLFGWLACARRLQLGRRLGWAVGIVFLAYLALPSQLFGGSGLDHRLPVALCSLLIAASEPRFRSRRAAVAVGLVTGSVLLARLAIIEDMWRRADRIYAADLVGIDALPHGVKLAVGIPGDAIHMVAVPEVHLAALAVVLREAFVPTLFAYQGQQPIALKPPYAALAEMATPQHFWTVLTGGDTAEVTHLLPVLQQYDYVVLTGGGPLAVPANPCLATFFRQPTFEIFTVLHDAACGSADG